MTCEDILHLKWKNHYPLLHRSFSQLLTNIESTIGFEDATIACQGKLFPVHRVILSTCSDYFSQIFRDTFSNIKHPIIILKDIDSNIFETILEYIYLGEIHVERKRLPELASAAICLNIKGLSEIDGKSIHNSDGIEILDSTSITIQKKSNRKKFTVSEWQKRKRRSSTEENDCSLAENNPDLGGGRKLRRIDDKLPTTPLNSDAQQITANTTPASNVNFSHLFNILTRKPKSSKSAECDLSANLSSQQTGNNTIPSNLNVSHNSSGDHQQGRESSSNDVDEIFIKTEKSEPHIDCVGSPQSMEDDSQFESEIISTPDGGTPTEEAIKTEDCQEDTLNVSNSNRIIDEGRTNLEFACPACDFISNIKDDLDHHITTSHAGSSSNIDGIENNDVNQNNSPVKAEILFSTPDIPGMSIQHEQENPFNLKFNSLKTKLGSKKKSKAKRNLPPLFEGKSGKIGEAYRCVYCSFVTLYKAALASHEKQHVRQHKCSLCEFRSTHSLHLEDHMKNHGANKLFECPHCTYSSGFESILVKHINRDHISVNLENEKLINLQIKKSKTSKKLFYSANRIKAIKKFSFKPAKRFSINNPGNRVALKTCDQISLNISDSTNQQNNEDKMDQLDTNKSIPSADEPVAIVGRSIYVTVTNGIYRCNDCFFCTVNKFDMDAHQRNHELKKKYVCQNCDYRVASKQHLERHLSNYLGTPAIQCKTCNYRMCVQNSFHRSQCEYYQDKFTKAEHAQSNLEQSTNAEKRSSREPNLEVDEDKTFDFAPVKNDEADNLSAQENTSPLKTSNCGTNQNISRTSSLSEENKNTVKMFSVNLELDSGSPLREGNSSRCEVSKNSTPGNSVKSDDSELPDIESNKNNSSDLKSPDKSNVVFFNSYISIMNNVYRCNECFYYTTSEIEMDAHQSHHESKKKFHCTKCDYRCIKSSNLVRHSSRNLSSTFNKCQYCGYKMCVVNSYHRNLCKYYYELLTTNTQTQLENVQLKEPSTRDVTTAVETEKTETFDFATDSNPNEAVEGLSFESLIDSETGKFSPRNDKNIIGKIKSTDSQNSTDQMLDNFTQAGSDAPNVSEIPPSKNVNIADGIIETHEPQANSNVPPSKDTDVGAESKLSGDFIDPNFILDELYKINNSSIESQETSHFLNPHRDPYVTVVNDIYRCNECFYFTDARTEMDAHQAEHKSLKKHLCKNCDYRCTQGSHLKRHVSKYLGGPILICEWCGIRKCVLNLHHRKDCQYYHTMFHKITVDQLHTVPRPTQLPPKIKTKKNPFTSKVSSSKSFDFASIRTADDFELKSRSLNVDNIVEFPTEIDDIDLESGNQEAVEEGAFEKYLMSDPLEEDFSTSKNDKIEEILAVPVEKGSDKSK